MIKSNFRILKKKTHAYLQTILKAPVKFQKYRPKTVGGGLRGQGTNSLYTSVVLELKMSKLKMRKSDKKLFQNSEKKNTCIFSGHSKSPCKVSKGSAKNCGRS